MANYKGRSKGSKNITTRKGKELYLKVLEGQSEYIEEAFEKLRQEDSFKYLSVIHKFSSFVIPKLRETKTEFYYDGEGEAPFNIKDVFRVEPNNKEDEN